MQRMRWLPTIPALLLVSAALHAQDLQVSGRAGWGGRVVRGDWAPAAIDLDNRGGDRDLVVAVCWAAGSANQPVDRIGFPELAGRMGPVHEERLVLPARTRKRLSVSLLTPDSDRLSLWAYAIDPSNGKTLARGELVAKPVDPGRRLVAVVGLSRPAGFTPALVELASILPDELPEDWTGYAALDALLWLDGKATEIRSTAQVDALRHWISGGGRLIVARANMVDLAGTSIAELLPVKAGTSREVESLAALKRDDADETPSGRTMVLESSVRQGRVRLTQDGVPLVVEATQDAGTRIFLAFDPSRPPFSTWKGAFGFWGWLVPELRTAPPSPAQNEAHAPRIIGCVALAQQAGRFPDVAAPEVGGLFLVIAVYLVIVGPFDFFFLRWLKRLEWTWFTFPGYVVLFTLFILLAGGAFLQRAAHLREIAVVDHYADSGFSRRRVIGAILAPADGVYGIDDALPVSSNFYSQSMYIDTASQVTDVRVSRRPVPLAANWGLNSGSTGLALADRCGNEPSPLSWVVESRGSVDLRLRVNNRSGREYDNTAFVTADGVYGIARIPTGENTVEGSRLAENLADYVAKEGQSFKRRPQYEEEDYRWRQRQSGAATEEQLLPGVRKMLVGLTLPPPESDASAEVLSGMARGLDAGPWLRSGGSLLLAWSTGERAIPFHPAPNKHSSVTLHRFFQRATP